MKVLTVAISLSLCTPLWAETDKKPDLSPDKLAQQVMDKFYPPSITEIFDNAKRNGLLGGWDKKIQVQTQDYASMKAPRRALEVGESLADIVFLMLTNENKDAAPDKSLIESAFKAIIAVNPPVRIQTELQSMRERYEAGKLKNKELRKEVDRLINEVVPTITNAQDPAQRDAGELVMTAGYFKALYMGAETLSNLDKPTQEQLEMIHAWKDITGHVLSYIAKATPEFKSSVEVQNLVRALVTIKPLVSKARDQITKEDTTSIATALKPIFG
jgi:hypothetical protein